MMVISNDKISIIFVAVKRVYLEWVVLNQVLFVKNPINNDQVLYILIRIVFGIKETSLTSF